MRAHQIEVVGRCVRTPVWSEGGTKTAGRTTCPPPAASWLPDPWTSSPAGSRFECTCRAGKPAGN